MTSKLLFAEEHPLQVLPRVAEVIGVNEAIVLQQIYYWINTYREGYLKSDKFGDKYSYHLQDGHYWVYNTFEEWQKNFPWLSVRQIKRIFSELEEAGVLVSGNFNKNPYDRTKWYRIDKQAYGNYEKLKVEEKAVKSKNMTRNS
jgi:hypothetical protein